MGRERVRLGDVRLIRAHPDAVREALRNRLVDMGLVPGGRSVEEVLELDRRHREVLGELQRRRRALNEASERVAELRRRGEDVAGDVAAARGMKEGLARTRDAARQVWAELEAALLALPNVPRADVPVGAGEADDVVMREEGERRRFGFEPRPHKQLGEALGVLDFRRGARIAGSGFVAMVGAGAALERALTNFMLDVHTSEHGYQEVRVPGLTREECLEAVGVEGGRAVGGRLSAVAAKAALTNLHRGEILNGSELPRRYVGRVEWLRGEWTAESWEATRAARGLPGERESSAVQLMTFTSVEESEAELQRAVGAAESVLKHLDVPYRVVALCTARLPWASAKTIALQAHCPGAGEHVTVSECSLYEAYQARRCNTRYRPTGGKPQFVHTVGGSAAEVRRVLAAVLENYQREDGRVEV
ncbi:MAG: aminoacyl--tRNA ligase-related protein, partial [Armatimonadota bacterium]